MAVELRRIPDDATIAVETVPAGLDPGVSTPVQFLVTPEEASGGVVVVVDPGDAVAECGLAPQRVEWTNLPCTDIAAD